MSNQQTGPTPKAPQNQKMSKEQLERMQMIEAKCGNVMLILDGMLVNDAIATLETCKGIIQSRLKRIYDEVRITRDGTTQTSTEDELQES